MNEYNAIFEALQEKLNNGEITLEQAQECNDLAYEKYVKELQDEINFDDLTAEDVIEMTEGFIDIFEDEEETEITESEKELSPEEKEKIEKRKKELKEKRKKLLKTIAACAALAIAIEALSRKLEKVKADAKEVEKIRSANKNFTKEINNARKLGAKISKLERKKLFVDDELKSSIAEVTYQDSKLTRTFSEMDRVSKKYSENGRTNFVKKYASNSPAKTVSKALDKSVRNKKTKDAMDTFQAHALSNVLNN